MHRPEIEPAIFQSLVRRLNHYTIEPPENRSQRLPRTKTSTAVEGSPGPSREYGVHVYFPSSNMDTGLMSSEPCRLTRMCLAFSRFIRRPSFDQTMTVCGGLDSTMQSMRPSSPRGKYSLSGMFTTRARSASYATSIQLWDTDNPPPLR